MSSSLPRPPNRLDTGARTMELAGAKRSDGVPDHLGPYVIEELIGRGGMGEVYEAMDPRLGRKVALKIVSACDTDASWTRRFLAEARITSQLEHPSIVPLYDVGRAKGLLWFAMRRVEGRSLRDVLADDDAVADWPIERLLGAFVQVCGAVAYAHERGVLHRDLKPDNIMLGRFGEVQVLDWGVAGLVGAVRRPRTSMSVDRGPGPMTLDGDMLGTPEVRSDVWSLGAILYEIVGGRRAWPQSGLNEYLAALWTERLPPDPQLTASGHRMFDDAVGVALRALAYEPRSRLPTAADLGQAVRGDPTLDPEAGPPVGQIGLEVAPVAL
ncbi:MAG: serine/threonine protein kinase [Proteobacteria bacterium]|nr:serine/threonine protein kinase [Pseudomonadota bacterium]